MYLKKKLRALFVDCAVVYINPTANYLAELTAQICEEVDYFGPGFSTPKILSEGIIQYCEKNGPYDMIFFGSSLSVLGDRDDLALGSANYIKKFTANDLLLADIVSFLRDFQKSLPKMSRVLKIAYCLNYDYYGASKERADWLDAHDFVLIVPGPEFVSRFADLPDHAFEEKHFRLKRNKISDIWYNFLMSKRSRVISSLHFVAPSEFFYENISTRPIKVSVPGVEYVLRKQALSHLSSAGLAPPKNNFMLSYSIANKLGLPIFSNYYALRIYNLAFMRTLSRSRLIYTAPEASGIPIRKFFEIPSAGAVLICSPCNGIKEIGFQDGVNYVRSNPDQLVNVVLELSRDPEGAQIIARRGQEMIRKKHSLVERARQVRNCLDLIVSGNYHGSEWVDGEHQIFSRPLN